MLLWGNYCWSLQPRMWLPVTIQESLPVDLWRIFLQCCSRALVSGTQTFLFLAQRKMRVWVIGFTTFVPLECSQSWPHPLDWNMEAFCQVPTASISPSIEQVSIFFPLENFLLGWFLQHPTKSDIQCTQYRTSLNFFPLENFLFQWFLQHPTNKKLVDGIPLVLQKSEEIFFKLWSHSRIEIKRQPLNISLLS